MGAHMMGAQQRSFGFRCGQMVVGLLFIGAGIALAKCTATGTSPISCIPAVMTEICARYDLPRISLGMFSFLFNALLLAGEIALLRGKVSPKIFLQLVPLAVMTVSIDIWAIPFGMLPLDGYLISLVALLVSVVFMSVGVFLEVDADVLAVPGDEFVKVLAQVTGEPFSVIKTTFDCSLMAFSASLSLMLLEGLFGVREGTVVNAMLVGIFIGLWRRLFGRETGPKTAQEAEAHAMLEEAFEE